MPLNLSYLEEITGGDIDMMKEMLDLFITDIPVHLANIEKYFNDGDFKKMGTEAHQVKPTMQYIGELDMYELVKEIELTVKQEKNTDPLPNLINDLLKKQNACINELREKRAELD